MDGDISEFFGNPINYDFHNESLNHLNHPNDARTTGKLLYPWSQQSPVNNQQKLQFRPEYGASTSFAQNVGHSFVAKPPQRTPQGDLPNLTDEAGKPVSYHQLSDGNLRIECREGHNGGARIMIHNTWPKTRFQCAVIRQTSEKTWAVVVSTDRQNRELLDSLAAGGIAQRAPSVQPRTRVILHFKVIRGKLRTTPYCPKKSEDAEKRVRRGRVPTLEGTTVFARFTTDNTPLLPLIPQLAPPCFADPGATVPTMANSVNDHIDITTYQSLIPEEDLINPNQTNNIFKADFLEVVPEITTIEADNLAPLDDERVASSVSSISPVEAVREAPIDVDSLAPLEVDSSVPT
eukprot:Lankesteria_metandrocarpae@DN3302_c0_g1_i1.p1